MHNFVSSNQQIIPAEDANISALSSASFYGKGIFTTISVHQGKPFLWEKHWRRLSNNAKTIGLHLPEKELIETAIYKIILANKITNGKMRVSVFDESPGKIWSDTSLPKTSILITTADLRTISEIKLSLSQYNINSTSPLAKIKSCNYLENILALENATKNGFDEAIRLNERGEITSACMANIFWVKDSRLYTPSLKTGCLAGTIRELIIENFDVFEVEESHVGFAPEEIFVTSSGIGIVPAFLKSNTKNREISNTNKDLQTMLHFNQNFLT
jgi:branched-subunit amino acid aminotransferase/4-amino-4-deoxychorismate lyase